jgi:hypothetical protein
MQYTNPTAMVWDVGAGPATTSTAYPQVSESIFLMTDDTGKISGSGRLTVLYNTNGPVTYMVADVTGKISNKTAGSAPTVSLSLKASGLTDDTATPGFGVPATASLKFSGTVMANPNTNSEQKQVIGGTLTGTLKGVTPLSAKSASLNFATVLDDTASNAFESHGAVLQSSNNKIQFFAEEATGTGTIKSGAYKVTVKGIELAKGLSATVSGNLGPYTNTVVSGTNSTPVVFQAPITGNLTATDKGQKISGTAPTINASLIWD